MPAPGRRLLWLLSLALALGSGSALAWLRLGRPLYYTDGQFAIRGDLLPGGSNLSWQRPLPEIELPGPVRGRVQPMPDGTWIYGRVQPDGSSDLVRFDPERPALGTIALAELNSPFEEFAPALGSGAVLMFSSDRPGGAGGFDVWVARVEGRAFTPPLPVAELNTEADESDPAPAADGGIVFVRRPRDEAGLAPTLLWRLGRDGSVAPIFGPGAPGTRERDPGFAQDGRSLWFVRETAGAPAQVMRTWTHRDQFVAPQAHPELTAPGGLRSPAPLAGGFALLLLGAGDAPLVYRSEARELWPWWEGQRALERLALITLIGALVCLLLLWLGLRFRQLDVITWCLLASLLLHLLALLLFGRLQIVHRFEMPPGETDRIAVQLVAPESAQATGGAGSFRPSDEIAFAGHEQDLQAEAPAPGAPAAARATELPRLPEFATPAARAPQVASSPVQDRIEAQEARREHDAARATAAAALAAAVQRESAAPASAPPASAQPISVAMPGSAVAAVAATRALDALPEPAAERRPTPLPAAELRESSSQVAVDATQVAAAAPSALALPESVARAAPAPQRAPGVQAATPAVAQPASTLAAVPAARELPATPLPVPLARAGRPVASPQLREPAAAVTSRTASDEAPVPSAQAMPSLAAADLDAQPARASAPPAAESPTAPADGLSQPRSQITAAELAAPQLQPRALTPITATLREPLAGAPQPAVAASAPAAAAEPRPRALAEAAPVAVAAMPVRRAAPEPAIEPRPQRQSELGLLRAAPPPAAVPVLPLRRRELPGPVPSRQTVEPLAAAVPAAPRADAPRAGPACVALTELQPRAEQLPVPRCAQPQSATPRPEPPPSFVAALPRERMPAAEVAAPELFQNRFGVAKVKALEQFGGSKETEEAVRRGLRYLASIQNGDGSWGDEDRRDRKYGEVRIGKSALCLLAFLGAGHVPGGDGEHAPVAARAVQFLLAMQDGETGHFGETSSYSHGITTYALAECYGIAKDPGLRQPLARALSWIVRQQNRTRDARNRGGWGYFSPSLRPEDRYSRASITAWMVMALESAKLAGLDVGDEPFQLARQFLLQSFDSRYGYFLYNREPGRLRSSWRTLPGSTPASVFALSLLGVPREDYRMRAGLEWTLERAPDSYRRFSDDEFVLQGAGNVYFWYYGTLACFVAGGEAWDEWNRRLKQLLPDAQDEDGSFAPIDTYARYAGDDAADRSYTTALCVLSLEVYYRYFTPLLVGR